MRLRYSRSSYTPSEAEADSLESTLIVWKLKIKNVNIQNIGIALQLSGTLKSWASLVIFGGCGDREKGVLFSKSLENTWWILSFFAIDMFLSLLELVTFLLKLIFYKFFNLSPRLDSRTIVLRNSGFSLSPSWEMILLSALNSDSETKLVREVSL